MFRKLLLAATCLMPAAAQAEWQEGSSKHFLVYSDDTPEHVQKMTADLERFDKAVRTSLALKEPEVGPDARVVVFVLPTTTDVQKMMGDKTGHVGGYYQSRSPAGPFAFVPKKSSDDSDRSLTPRMTLQHEYTHHVMYSNFGDVVFPTWFSEGFAELFATARTQGDGSVVIGAVPAYRTYGINLINQVPIDKLVSRGPDYHDGLQTQVFYGRAWLLTHYLMFAPERSKQLAAYIVAINDGKSAEDANKALALTSSLDFKLNGYGKRSALPAITLTPDKLPIGDVTSRALTAGESATMMARMRSHNGVDEKSAQDVVVLARTTAAPFPTDAGAQNELAEAEYDSGNYAASEAAASRAMAADPKSVHALIYKGMAQMALAKAAKNTDPAVWTTARRWFLSANKRDPLYSWPIQLYYESFHQAGQAAPKPAQDALLYAYKLAPQNIGLRLEAANVLLATGQTKAAHIALEPIAYSPHGGALVDVAKKAIVALDTSGAPAAMTVLEQLNAKPKAAPDKPGGAKS